MVTAEVMLPVLAGLFGAIVGAAATALVAYWTLQGQFRLERARWSYEDDTRFISDKRKIYAQFVSSVNEVAERLGALMVTGEDDEVSEETMMKTRLEQLGKVYRRVRRLGEEIELVGSDPVIAAWLSVLDQLRSIDPDVLRAKSEDKEKFQNEIGERVRQFVNAARAELRVVSSHTLSGRA